MCVAWCGFTQWNLSNRDTSEKKTLPIIKAQYVGLRKVYKIKHEMRTHVYLQNYFKGVCNREVHMYTHLCKGGGGWESRIISFDNNAIAQ